MINTTNSCIKTKYAKNVYPEGAQLHECETFATRLSICFNQNLCNTTRKVQGDSWVKVQVVKSAVNQRANEISRESAKISYKKNVISM